MGKIKAVRPPSTSRRRYDVDDFLARHSNLDHKLEPNG
jgi:hypothetical protein